MALPKLVTRSSPTLPWVVRRLIVPQIIQHAARPYYYLFANLFGGFVSLQDVLVTTSTLIHLVGPWLF